MADPRPGEVGGDEDDSSGVWETPCPNAPADDPLHCEHWYDDAAPCCRCGDDGDKTHGDHHPSLDCLVCAERIAEGHVSYMRTYELAEVRYERTGRSFPLAQEKAPSTVPNWPNGPGGPRAPVR